MSESTQTVVERAQAEVERRWPYGISFGPYANHVYEACRGSFAAGATFAATITPEQVEAAARALCEHRYGSWDRVSDLTRDSWRRSARAALRAAGFEVQS